MHGVPKEVRGVSEPGRSVMAAERPDSAQPRHRRVRHRMAAYKPEPKFKPRLHRQIVPYMFLISIIAIAISRISIDDPIGSNGDMSDEHETDGAKRDWRGRFVKSVSGNPTGRPRGIVSETTRIATLLLSERAPELVNAAIDRALAGKDMPLNLGPAKIIPPPTHHPL